MMIIIDRLVIYLKASNAMVGSPELLKAPNRTHRDIYYWQRILISEDA